MTISILSVLYNQRLEDCRTWHTLLLPALTDYEHVRVILTDNSTEGTILRANEKAAEKYKAVYLPMQGNKGIPAAYNRAVEEILQTAGHGKETAEGNPENRASDRDIKRNPDDWIVLTDQDTVFPGSYLSVLTEDAGHTACDILAPVVKAGEKKLSPCRKAKNRFLPLEAEKPDAAELQEAYFINTGLALRQSLFAEQKMRYDERLFLDFADFDMINRLRAAGCCSAGMLPGITLEQGFSGTEKGTAEQALERFRLFVRDAGCFYETWYGKKEAASAIRSRGMRLTMKYRDPRFLYIK